ncbi:MAG: anti-sigma factor domain-containing protein [Peptococcaceae bacterium]|nr:anti-sigma factor domain-containing protein [Peptococcaceae bacterium]
MTGMLLEIRKNTSIVLGNDGQVYKIKRTPKDTVGKTLELSSKQIRTVKRKRFAWRVASRFLAVSIVVVAAGILWQLFQTHSMEALTHIDVESQSSLYFIVDQNYRVVVVEAKDENGRKMLEFLDLRGVSMEKALEKVFQAERSRGGSTSAAIAVTSSHAHNHIENLPFYQELSSDFESLDLFYVQPEQWNSYIGQDISPAKAALVESILSDEPVDSQEWVSKSVQDIREGLSSPPLGQPVKEESQDIAAMEALAGSRLQEE